MDGTVKWFNTRKGYGFIKGDDEQEYFVHFSAIPQGARLNENDRVTFDPADTERGKQAQNVQTTGAGEAPAQEAAPAEASAEGSEGAPAQEAPAEAPVEEGSETFGEEEEAPAEEPKSEEAPAEEPKSEEAPAEEEKKPEEGQ